MAKKKLVDKDRLLYLLRHYTEVLAENEVDCPLYIETLHQLGIAILATKRYCKAIKQAGSNIDSK